VANKLYESCRAGHVEVCGFPQYSHLVSALQNIQTEESQVSYQVCVKRHDRLLVLSALASKFLECEDLKDDAKSLIEQHNANYNPDGDWLAEPEPTRTIRPIVFCLLLPHLKKTCIFLGQPHQPNVTLLPCLSQGLRWMMKPGVLTSGSSWSNQSWPLQMMWST